MGFTTLWGWGRGGAARALGPAIKQMEWQGRIPGVCWRGEEASPCPDVPICCMVLTVNTGTEAWMCHHRKTPLALISNPYQISISPNQLAPLQELDASKHHAWHEREWEEELWHPWAGEVEPLGNHPGRHWKGSNQLSKPVITEQPHPQQAAGWMWASLRGWL